MQLSFLIFKNINILKFIVFYLCVCVCVCEFLFYCHFTGVLRGGGNMG